MISLLALIKALGQEVELKTTKRINVEQLPTAFSHNNWGERKRVVCVSLIKPTSTLCSIFMSTTFLLRWFPQAKAVRPTVQKWKIWNGNIIFFRLLTSCALVLGLRASLFQCEHGLLNVSKQRPALRSTTTKGKLPSSASNPCGTSAFSF